MSDAFPLSRLGFEPPGLLAALGRPATGFDAFLQWVQLQWWIYTSRLDYGGPPSSAGFLVAFGLLVAASVSARVRPREWAFCALAFGALILQTLLYGQYLSSSDGLQAAVGISFSVALVWVICLIGKSLR